MGIEFLLFRDIMFYLSTGYKIYRTSKKARVGPKVQSAGNTHIFKKKKTISKKLIDNF